MSNNHVAITGVGQTQRYKTKLTCSMAGLVREAALKALADANCSWDDIDAVVIGKAPDMFEGVVMPEPYLAEALGGVNKPVIRVHTAGSVGGSTAIVAANHIKSGLFRRHNKRQLLYNNTQSRFLCKHRNNLEGTNN